MRFLLNPPALVVLSLTGSLLSACSSPEPERAPTTAATTPSPTTTASTGPTPPPLLSTIDTPVAACFDTPSAAPEYLRRLTNNEYLRTVTDLLHLEPSEMASIQLVIEGFGNDVAGLPITNVHIERYGIAASNLAELVLSDPTRRQKLVSCELSGSEACLTQFIESVGKAAFRRPLSSSRVSELLTVARAAASEPDPYAGAKLALEAMLLSPRFLYRVESKNPETPLPVSGEPVLASARLLDGYEVATRLSYLLFGTTPDNNLLALAESGALSTREGIEAQTRSMLSDPRAHTGVGEFVDNWLHLYNIHQIPRPAETYPSFTAELRGSMQAETKRFLDDFVWSPSARFMDVFTANYSYVDANLAAHYGVQASGPGLSRVDWPAGSRGGLLGQAAMLTLPVAGGETTAPILRGQFVRKQFLCTPPPPPPGAVPAVPTDPNLTVRERLSQHAATPGCWSCHQLLDPIGFGLEQYDLIGGYRTTGVKNEPLTGEGTVIMGTRQGKFVGPQELGQILATTADTAACVVKHLYSYTYGRTPTGQDDCARKNAVKSFQDSGYNFQNLLVSMVGAEDFRHVSTVEPAASSATP